MRDRENLVKTSYKGAGGLQRILGMAHEARERGRKIRQHRPMRKIAKVDDARDFVRVLRIAQNVARVRIVVDDLCGQCVHAWQ